MNHLIQSRSFLADAGLPSNSDTWSALHGVIDVVGVLGCLVIVLLLLLALTMIPDFFRYLRIKSM